MTKDNGIKVQYHLRIYVSWRPLQVQVCEDFAIFTVHIHQYIVIVQPIKLPVLCSVFFSGIESRNINYGVKVYPRRLFRWNTCRTPVICSLISYRVARSYKSDRILNPEYNNRLFMRRQFFFFSTNYLYINLQGTSKTIFRVHETLSYHLIIFCCSQMVYLHRINYVHDL